MPTDVAGRPAYGVRIAPKPRRPSRRRRARLGRRQRHASGGGGLRPRVSSPVLELKVTDISLGSVPASVFAISPPPGTKVDRHLLAEGPPPVANSRHAQSPGSLRSRKQVNFRISAPSSLSGFPRQGTPDPRRKGKWGPRHIRQGAGWRSPSSSFRPPTRRRTGLRPLERPEPAEGLDQRRLGPGARHRARHSDPLQARRRRVHGRRLGAAAGVQDAARGL